MSAYHLLGVNIRSKVTEFVFIKFIYSGILNFRGSLSPTVSENQDFKVFGREVSQGCRKRMWQGKVICASIEMPELPHSREKDEYQETASLNS